MYPIMNTVPLTKQIFTIGDGTNRQINVPHGSAPNVTCSVYNSISGVEARPDVTFFPGFVRFDFADIPGPGQYTVVLIG